MTEDSKTGWKLVPIEPTPEMYGAGGVQQFKCDVSGTPVREAVGMVYRAMLAAAPVNTSTGEEKPVAFASEEQIRALPKDPENEGGAQYIPLRRGAAGKFQMPLYTTPRPASELVTPLREEDRPLVTLPQLDRDLPEWQQIVALFQRNGLAEPHTRLRDVLVNHLVWARYGEALDAALTQTSGMAASIPTAGVPEGWRMVPEDAVTHLGDFNEACTIAWRISVERGDTDNASYWQHQVNTIKEIRSALTPIEGSEATFSKPFRASSLR